MATVWLYLNEQKNLCLSFNKLSMKRPWPGGFFLAFSHNTILLTPWMQMKTPKSNSLTRKDWFIHYCILWPVITASPQYFAPEGKKSVSLEVRCLKFIHHLPGYFDSLGKCFFFYIRYIRFDSFSRFWLFWSFCFVFQWSFFLKSQHF